jgi:hypothetical protein
MIFSAWRIDGPFVGVDPVVVYGALAVTVVVITIVAVLGRQVAALQPKMPAPGSPAVKKASNEFDDWTERPKGQQSKDAAYQSLYGSRPGPDSYVSSRAPAAPPSPGMGEVVVNIGPAARVSDAGWVNMPVELGPSSAASSAPPPSMYPPARLRPSGPTDDVVAPSHARRGRDSSTGELPSEGPSPPTFERSSTQPGALGPRSQAGDPYSPRAPAVPGAPQPPRGLDEAGRMKVAQALPEGAGASTRGAFRQSARDRTVMGAGASGMGEGQDLTPSTKTIRCPKCATVFPGPATRPATVKCPACGTSGTLR